MAVPANFGGVAYSNPYFLWSRWVFESMIANAGIDAVNCSDGIAIAGARAVRPDDLQIPDAALDKAEVIRQVKGMTRHFAPGAYLDTDRVDAAVASWHGFARDVRDFLGETLEEADDLISFERELVRFLEASDAKYGGAVVTLHGSMRSMVPVANFFLNRAPDEAAYRRYMAAFRETFREQIEGVILDADAMFGEIAARHGTAESLREAG
ncbi:MAG: hypothetical protein JJ899_18140 [Alphaproteobacteria bacterium]|nr:hypothetical protein [Alphaproteobacteria bacterium]